MHAKGLIILLITITVLTGVVFAWYDNQITQSMPKFDVPQHKVASDNATLGGALYAKAANPVASSPDSNPLKDNVTNPFDTYKNPFDTSE